MRRTFDPSAPSVKVTAARRTSRFRSIFCSFLWPRFPCFSGADVRDFHLLRHLVDISDVEFFALDDQSHDGRQDLLAGSVTALHTPATIERDRPDLIDASSLQRSVRKRCLGHFQRNRWPFFGLRHHRDVADKTRTIGAYLRGALQLRLEQSSPDLLFVSPQSNPVGLMLDCSGSRTRTIMVSYDVEAVRMERIAASHSGLTRLALAIEARRAARFERHNLAAYDGVIAVSELDKNDFVGRYGLDPQRVLVIENGVDHDYFAFAERRPRGRPRIVFVSSFAYGPNRQAAWRLIEGVMPRVRRRHSEAELWIVGQDPGERLRRASDGVRTTVTGTVPDVRPYLRRADVACVPLLAGSGIKNKVLEAMSAGVPLVCTGLSLLGMDVAPDEHVLVGETDAEIAAAIMRLLDDPGLAAAMARRARRHVVQRYDWNRNLARLDGWLDRMRERRAVV